MKEAWRSAREAFYQGNFARLNREIFDTAAQYDDCFWLSAPSSYIFKTNGVLWGMDLRCWPDCDFPSEGLSKLSFVIITHDHSDHFNLNMLAALGRAGVKVVLPCYIAPERAFSCGLLPENTVFLPPGGQFKGAGLCFLAFESLHFRPRTQKGVPELGYLATVTAGANRSKTLLFPGDVRNYDRSSLALPDITADALFAHVWLGDEGGKNPPDDGILASFGAFFASFSPKKVFLTHLYSTERALPEMWSYAHAGYAMDAIAALSPESALFAPRLCQRLSLFEPN